MTRLTAAAANLIGLAGPAHHWTDAERRALAELNTALVLESTARRTERRACKLLSRIIHARAQHLDPIDADNAIEPICREATTLLIGRP